MKKISLNTYLSGCPQTTFREDAKYAKPIWHAFVAIDRFLSHSLHFA
jgi:hypothetical protein